MVDSLKWAHMPLVRDDVKPLTIVHLFPELLNLYGDGGNVIALTRRLQWRGLPVEVREIGMGDAMDFSQADIVFIGGGADREQMIVKDAMAARKNELSAYVSDGGVLLAVCGGYQFLGHSYAMDDVVVEGLGVIDIETVRGEGRLIGNAVIQSDICETPIVGFENHGGRTTLGPDAKPLGRVLGKTFGNNGEDGFEGVHQGISLEHTCMVLCCRKTRRSPIILLPAPSSVAALRSNLRRSMIRLNFLKIE